MTTNKQKDKKKLGLREKMDFILKHLDEAGDITVCSECGELMVVPLGFDINPICSKIDWKLKDIERANIVNASTDWYMERIGDLFDRLEVFSTAGDFRPPYAFQWIAYSKVPEGDDDAFAGIGRSPHEAIKQLYKSLKANL